jgi:hypothetical protein
MMLHFSCVEHIGFWTLLYKQINTILINNWIRKSKWKEKMIFFQCVHPQKHWGKVTYKCTSFLHLIFSRTVYYFHQYSTVIYMKNTLAKQVNTKVVLYKDFPSCFIWGQKWTLYCIVPAVAFFQSMKNICLWV